MKRTRPACTGFVLLPTKTVGWMMGDHQPLNTPRIYAGFRRLPHGSVLHLV